jgi:hypothetical protein
MKARSSAVSTALLTVLAFSACDMMERIGGKDPLGAVVRNNPVDPGSIAPIDTSAALPDGITVTTSRPSFRFEYANGIASYTLQIFAARDFSVPAIVEETAITEQTHRISTSLQDDTTYYWRIRPRYIEGTEGGWSQPGVFQVDIASPSIPNAGYPIRLDTPYPLLLWESPEGIDTFEISLSTTWELLGDAGTRNAIGSSFKWNEPLDDNRTYYWRVRSIDSGSPSGWSQTGVVMIGIPIPSIVSPMGGNEVSDPRPSLRWRTTAYYSSSDILQYQIQIDTSLSFQGASSFFFDETYQGAGEREYEYAIPSQLSANQDYFWRVRARYSETHFGAWSEPSSFHRNRVSRIVDAAIHGKGLIMGPDKTLFTYNGGWIEAWSPGGSPIWAKQNHAYSDACLLTPAGRIISANPSTSSILSIGTTGDTVWSYKSASSAAYAGLAVGSDGNPYIAEADSSTGSLVALDSSGGNRWKYSFDSYISAPSIGTDGSIYVFSDDRVFALSSSGSKRWETALAGHYASITEIVVGRGGALFLAGENSAEPYPNETRMYAISASDGSILWSRGFSNTTRSRTPIVDADGTVYFACGTTYYAIEPDDGSIKWSIPFEEALFSGTIGNDGVIYIPCFQRFIALRKTDGAILWRVALDTNYVYPAVIDSDGSLWLAVDSDSKPGFYIIPTTATGLADSPWPTSRHDFQRSGRASAP